MTQNAASCLEIKLFMFVVWNPLQKDTSPTYILAPNFFYVLPFWMLSFISSAPKNAFIRKILTSSVSFVEVGHYPVHFQHHRWIIQSLATLNHNPESALVFSCYNIHNNEITVRPGKAHNKWKVFG